MLLEAATCADGADHLGLVTDVACSLVVGTVGFARSAGARTFGPGLVRQPFAIRRSVAVTNEAIDVFNALAKNKTVPSDGVRSPRSSNEM